MEGDLLVRSRSGDELIIQKFQSQCARISPTAQPLCHVRHMLCSLLQQPSVHLPNEIAVFHQSMLFCCPSSSFHSLPLLLTIHSSLTSSLNYIIYFFVFLSISVLIGSHVRFLHHLQHLVHSLSISIPFFYTQSSFSSTSLSLLFLNPEKMPVHRMTSCVY